MAADLTLSDTSCIGQKKRGKSYVPRQDPGEGLPSAANQGNRAAEVVTSRQPTEQAPHLSQGVRNAVRVRLMHRCLPR